jgi:hypothetical protein
LFKKYIFLKRLENQIIRGKSEKEVDFELISSSIDYMWSTIVEHSSNLLFLVDVFGKQKDKSLLFVTRSLKTNEVLVK